MNKSKINKKVGSNLAVVTDETSTSTVQKPRNIVTLKGQKQVSQVTSSERGTLVTTCCFVNNLSYSLPPVMMQVFPRVNFKQHTIKEAPTGTLDLANSLS